MKGHNESVFYFIYVDSEIGKNKHVNIFDILIFFLALLMDNRKKRFSVIPNLCMKQSTENVQSSIGKKCEFVYSISLK